MKFLPGRPIVWILGFALLLRLWGVTYGLPQFFVNDERANVYGALKMLELKTLVPRWHDAEFRQVLNYLPLPSYLYLVVLAPVITIGYLFSGAASLAAYRNLLALDPTLIFVTARVLIAVLGTATTYLAYRLGRAVFASERAALLTALFLALSFYHLQLSHVTRQWMPALFFLSLAWLAAAAIYRGGSRRHYLAAGLAVGLGVGANTAAAVALAPAVLAHFLSPAGGTFSARLKRADLGAMVAMALLVSLFFIWLYPYGFTQGETPGSSSGMFLQSKLASLHGKGVGEWLAFLWFYAKLLLTYETALFAAAIAGAVMAWRAHRRWLAIAAGYAIGYLSLLYLFFNIIERGVLFILPILAVFAGFGLDRLLLWFQSRIHPTFSAAVALFSLASLLFFTWPLAVASRYDQLLTRNDTRVVAAEWLYTHTPPGEKILADLPYLRLTNTRAGITTLGRVDPAGLRIQDRILAETPDAHYPQPAREVLNLHFVSPSSPYRAAPPDFFRARGYRFFVVERKYLDGHDYDPQSAELAASGRLVARFAGFRPGAFDRALDLSGEIATVPPWRFWDIERFGLIVDVYAL